MSDTPTIRKTRTVDEVAILLGLSSSAVYRKVATGEIPCVNIGGKRLVPVSWLAEQLHVEVSAV